ncbi:MAG: hypothetical protein ACYDHX_09435 [Methanothrix sp.]
MYGLAFDHLTGDNGACREVFQIGAGDGNTENLRGLARNGLTWRIAARALKAMAEDGRRSSIRLGTAAVLLDISEKICCVYSIVFNL